MVMALVGKWWRDYHLKPLQQSAIREIVAISFAMRCDAMNAIED